MSWKGCHEAEVLLPCPLADDSSVHIGTGKYPFTPAASHRAVAVSGTEREASGRTLAFQ